MYVTDLLKAQVLQPGWMSH